MILEVCDKLPLHWDDWWMPHIWAAGLCLISAAFGGRTGVVVGALAAACWSSACLALDLTDPIFSPDAIVRELGLWTYALHVLGMLLPVVAIGLTVSAKQLRKLAI